MLSIPLVLALACTTLAGCDSSPAENDPAVAENTAAEQAREQELAELEQTVKGLTDLDEILALAGGKNQFSTEYRMVRDRLDEIVIPKIGEADSERELRSLRKYTLPGGRSTLTYMNRSEELSGQ